MQYLVSHWFSSQYLLKKVISSYSSGLVEAAVVGSSLDLDRILAVPGVTVAY